MIKRNVLFLITTLMALFVGGCGDFEWFPDGTKPQSFSFATQAGVEKNTSMVSETVTITGNTFASPISVSNGEYSIDGGTYTSASGKINPRQKVCVRHKSADSGGTTTTVLTIGGVSASFTSITKVYPPTFTNSSSVQPFNSAEKSEIEPNTQVLFDSITISGNTSPAPVNVSKGEYAIEGGTFTVADGTINAGQKVQVRHTSAAGNNTPTITTLTIGGQSATFTSWTKVAPVVFNNLSTVSPVTSDSSRRITVTPVTAKEKFRTATNVSFTVTCTVKSTSLDKKNLGITIAGVDAKSGRVFSDRIDTTIDPGFSGPVSQDFNTDRLTISQYESIKNWFATKIEIF